jgi:hypothetical protein
MKMILEYPTSSVCSSLKIAAYKYTFKRRSGSMRESLNEIFICRDLNEDDTLDVENCHSPHPRRRIVKRRLQEQGLWSPWISSSWM